MEVPFVDLKTQYLNIKAEMDAAIQEVLMNSAFIKGPQVDQFEADFAALFGVKNCIGVANGTDAIYIVLKSLGIGEGDEVITTACSWISTSETISQTGARPVFVDVDPQYYTIDVAQIESKITPKTKAIIPVHLYGNACPMDEIVAICKKHNLYLIEDCAQSHLATWDGQLAGTFGIAATFSFFPGKNLGAYGDAGGIITNDDALARKMRMYANHGALKKHFHEIEGINSRLDGMQAAILNVKLKYLPKWTEMRIQNAKRYTELLAGVAGIVTPTHSDRAKHVFHLYVVRVLDDRAGLEKQLAAQGISTAVHYPTPLPLLPAYAYLNHTASDFPVAAAYKSQILSLPMFPELTDTQIKSVVETIQNYVSSPITSS